MRGLPEGWQTKPLKDVLQKTGSIDPRKNPDDGFEYIDVSSISRKTFSIEKTSSLKGKEAPSRARRQVRTGDVLFATIRPTLQRIAIVPEVLNGEVCSTGYFVLRPKEEVINNKFLYHFLFTETFMSAMESRQKGASYPAVNNGDVQEQLISFPSLPEQKRIVAILDEAFAGIDQAVANTEKNLANACEVFESYLNEIFSIQKKTASVPLSEITTCITDGDHSPPPKASEGIPFITISNINKTSRKIDFSNTFKVSEDYYNKLKSTRKPQSGDVLFTVTGSYGIPVQVPENIEFCFQRHIGLLRPDKNISSSWLYYMLLSPLVFRQATEGATGTAQKTVGLRVLRNIRVPRMTLQKQETVVKKLDAIWKETKFLESIYQKKLTALAELKQSILHKAFIGELTQAPEQELAEAC